MHTNKFRLIGVAVLPTLVAVALLMASPVVDADAVPSRVSNTVAVSLSAQTDPCGANQYGCYQPYGSCDTYQPGCAGRYDTGSKPYDYEQNKPYDEGLRS